ncbi:Ig-like domain-containing protein [Verrucomicrobium spinosum]|uniref:Ig-like domain-containing protein n=1 Tax=Verrucomicrobium spinosum TaxID=2736 RepID=UPI000946856D|nr:Ig-like domain-containing protein [Verrucomicrobium spinosum]
MAGNDFASGTADTPDTIEVLTNDSDPDDVASSFVLQTIDAVTVTGLPGLTNPASLFSVNNGREVVFTPGNALQSLGAGESITFHVYYTMADDSGAQASARLEYTVTGVNEAPVAVNDAATTNELQTVSFDVLGNDTDTDRSDVPARLILDAIESVTYDQNGTTITVATPEDLFVIDGQRLVFQPGETLRDLATGESVNFTVTYRVADAAGGTSTATFSLAVDGQAEVATTNATDTSGNAVVNIHQNAPVYTENLLDSEEAGSTIDLETLIVTTSDNTSAYGALLVSADGELTLDPDVASLLNIPAGQIRTLTLTYEVETPTNGTVVRTILFNITGAAAAPRVGGPLEVELTEAGGSLSLLDGATSNSALSLKNLTTLGGDQSGVTIDPVTGQVTVSSTAYQSLSEGEFIDLSYRYRLENADGLSTWQTAVIRITGSNDDLSGPATVDGTVNEGGVPLVVDLLANVTDSDAGDVVKIQSGSVVVTSSQYAAAVKVHEEVGTVTVDANHSVFSSLNTGQTANITLAYTVTDGNGSTLERTATIVVQGLTGTGYDQAIFTLVDAENGNRLGGASGLYLSGDGSRLYVTASDLTGANDNAVSVYDVLNGGKTLVRLDTAEEGVGDVANGLSGATDATGEPATFTTDDNVTHRFIVTAASGDSSLVAFEILSGNPLTFSQGPNPNGLNGLKDQDPTSRATSLSMMTGNPVRSADASGLTFYAVSDVDNALYVLEQQADNSIKVVQLLKDDITGEFGVADQGLSGAKTITVSPDGRFVFVGATQEGTGTGKITVYERASFTREVTNPATGLLMTETVDGLRPVTNAVFDTIAFQTGANQTNPVATLAVDPSGKFVYVSGVNGTEVFAFDADAKTLTSQAVMPDRLMDLEFLTLPDGTVQAYGLHNVPATQGSAAVSQLRVYSVNPTMAR